MLSISYEYTLSEVFVLDFCSGYCLNGGTCKMENGAPKCSCLSFRIQDEAKKAGNYGVKKYYGTRCQNVGKEKIFHDTYQKMKYFAPDLKME